MNKFKRVLLKILSIPHFNLKKHYKLYRRFLNIFKQAPEPIYKTLDHKIIMENREIPLRVFIPKSNPLQKVLIFFHGGGWVTGNIDYYTNVCTNLANMTNHIVVSVDYRLAPENPFPAGLEDCYYVAREIFKNPEILNCKKEDIVLIGDSAGGNLAAVVSLMARDKGEFLPTKQILIYPATNYDHSINSPYASVIENGENYIMTSRRIQDYMYLYVENEEDRLNPYVAPILSKDLSNQPKTLIITAEFDPLRDEGEAYGMKLRDFGNDVKIHRMKNMIHGFFSNPLSLDSIDEFYEIINIFLKD
ncbi:alpha/beta hydrolase [Tissierella pigra]|uniref:Alpha/beta hydrolase n=1 Tax=Tissierella pigra TaxID=2607614 RepID=A0A6N7XXD5_9FIRM|nr:alpha/beta hydrolase [Tissierella pigra]MBU5424906.1 alpha/beta hydrolase [Tissierella pigra]MSU01155.1 alpha/beta hydrolase [Tissierella pigra]